MSNNPNWIVVYDGSTHPFGHKCLRCGSEENLPLPIPLDAYLVWAQGFIRVHKHCKKIKEVIMNPTDVKVSGITINPYDMLINGILSVIFAVMKAQGLSEEEAKAALAAKVAQVEALPPLPMDV